MSLKDEPAYTISKSGLYGLTRVLADKWARLASYITGVSLPIDGGVMLR